MSSRFPCLRCGTPFADREDLQLHWEMEGHDPQQVQRDQLQAARESVGYHPEVAVVQRHRLKLINGGKR